MALPSLEKLEMNSSTPDHMKADSSGPENTWQQIFKSCSTHHHGFVDSIEQAMVLQKKYELETTTKFSCYKSDCLDLEVRHYFTAKVTPGRSRWEISPTTVCFRPVIFNVERFQEKVVLKA